MTDEKYEYRVYKVGFVELEAGKYTRKDLQELIEMLDKMNEANERSMKR
jgi:hypothetical protein